MAYEVDFISVSESESKQDADAITIRWKYRNGYKVVVYDGGFPAHGEKMLEHLNNYYFGKYDDKVIDAVVVSHSDQDHTSGLKVILENFKVNVLYMNRTWLYAKELYDKITDGRITLNSLEQRLRDKYSFIADLEEIAEEKGIPIYDAFEGDTIEDVFTVLSPSRDFYLDLIVESDKTPLEESARDVTTSAENEMSVVLYGNIGNDGMLLVGDAGIRALNRANDFAEANNISLKENVKFMQIPHHGGRHNVSPTLLNNIVGTMVSQGTTTGKMAFVCVAEKSDHPLQMVINAYIRRGVKVYTAKGRIIHHRVDMPAREGWVSLTQEKFNPNVEEWD